MVCEEYARRLTDAALGDLLASRRSELIAHTRACAKCRDVYERTQRAATLVDQGIETLVAGEPSPQFAARLRARIAGEPQGDHVAAVQWVPIVASALIFAAIATISLLKYDGRRSPAPSAASVSSISSELHTNAISQSGVKVRPSHSLRSHVHAVPSAQQPEVLVEPGQMAALLQLDEAIQKHSADAPRIVAQRARLSLPMQVEPLEIKSLDVSRIEDSVDPWGGY